VVDVHRESTSIHEANILKIPVIAMVDTNADPRNIDYVIPSNDDAIRAIKLVVGKIADAALEGLGARKEEVIEEEVRTVARAAVDEAELSDEELLGEATLAKLVTHPRDLAEAEIEAIAEELEANVEVEKGEEFQHEEDLVRELPEETGSGLTEVTGSGLDEEEASGLTGEEDTEEIEEPVAEEVENVETAAKDEETIEPGTEEAETIETAAAEETPVQVEDDQVEEEK
jgi:hypothetical protein